MDISESDEIIPVLGNYGRGKLSQILSYKSYLSISCLLVFTSQSGVETLSKGWSQMVDKYLETWLVRGRPSV